jgi:vacuolar-type H+-ATPase catalytic subunit A/Vma1
MDFDAKKWDLLRDYLVEENRKNAKLQKIIDTLQRDNVPEARQLVADIRSDVSERALQKYQVFVSGDIATRDMQDHISSRDDDIVGLR